MSGWRSCRAELAAGAGLVAVVTGAVYGYAGTGAAVLTLLGWAVAALVLLRAVVPAALQLSQAPRQEWHVHGGARTSFTGFWRKRRTLADATASMAAYHGELRPVLQHLLAARLAERHGVSLQADPDAARRLLAGGPAGDQLWRWLDPGQPAAGDAKKGIPPRTLAAIIDRLERL